MKKVFFVFATVICLLIVTSGVFTANAAFSASDSMKVDCRAAYLIDADTGTEMYSVNPDERYPIASMVKIMTALLAFEAINRGELSLDETICISENSSGMGGSQMFLDTGYNYSVNDLLKGIVVASANDACVAIAERLEGSEAAFVGSMNQKAKELGMNNTNFVNCSGLPAAGGYSSARDVAKMTQELVRCEKYFSFSKIWLEDYKHPDGRTTVLTNTNKLVRFYAGCDGGKTGYTSEAKFCLSATAKKNDMRVISVIIGASESKQRFADSRKLLDYAFANYKNEVVNRANVEAGRIAVANGMAIDIAFAPQHNISMLSKRGEQS
ncbi:MAG: D-alanyl-D-alanine carboxypeptidase, partial [Clostridia bacterium]|nr:D-alanyl-D-alanine carboxypeptidase [Clostridia bacterium]